MRCVVIDVGNTSTSLALYDAGRILRFAHVKGGIAHNPRACSEAVQRAARGGVHGAVLGSVVPGTNPLWTGLLTRELGCAPLVVRAGLRMTWRSTTQARTIGADRLANACRGGRSMARANRRRFSVTALTFDISRERCYVGGVIAPDCR